MWYYCPCNIYLFIFIGVIKMKQTIGLNEFRNAFQSHERTNFSYEGLAVIFNQFKGV
jgi:hypothetical protein